MPFDLKVWLDRHVVPLLPGPPVAVLHSFLQRASTTSSPPEDILVFLRAKDPTEWPQLAKRLIDRGEFRFDYLREAAAVRVGMQVAMIFGGDGTPFFNKEGTALCRLWKKVDGKNLILDVGGQFEGASKVNEAKDAVRAFFDQFTGVNALEVCAKFRPPFGE